MIPINIKKDHLFKRFFHNDVFFKYFVDALFEYLGMSERFQYKVIMS